MPRKPKYINPDQTIEDFYASVSDAYNSPGEGEQGRDGKKKQELLAEEFGISRQGVHDLIRRTDQVLEKYEEKLHLVERFLMVKDQAEEIGKLAHSISRDTGAFTDSEGSANHIRLERIIELAERLVDEL